jgi:hypothetical protein
MDEEFQGILNKSSSKELLVPLGKDILVKKIFFDKLEVVFWSN